MEARLNHVTELAPEILQQAIRLQQAIEKTGVDRTLLELIKIRVSQINGCAYCLHMHTRDAISHGEPEVRIHVLSAWRESRLFTARERAVLAYAEALTHVAERGAPEPLFDELKRYFSERELFGLCNAIAMINFWNRVAISLGYVSPHEPSAKASQSATQNA
jgi:AhpD family alkylhydroperoxidase